MNKTIIVRNRGTITAARKTRVADPEWLAAHGQQIMELIRGFGLDLSVTLRQLLEISTGHLISDPPKWCETGCAHNNDGYCDIIRRSADAANNDSPDAPEWDRRLAIQQRWDRAHDWDTPGRQPKHGILYDCPCYEVHDDP